VKVSVEYELSVSRKAEAVLFQGFVLAPALYSLYTNDALTVSGVRVAVFVYVACPYATEEGASCSLRVTARLTAVTPRGSKPRTSQQRTTALFGFVKRDITCWESNLGYPVVHFVFCTLL
jgi:hypothetical protein